MWPLWWCFSGSKNYAIDLRIESVIQGNYVLPSQLGYQYIEREKVQIGITKEQMKHAF